MNHIQEFRDAMTSWGLTPPEKIEDDGKRHRFAGDGGAGDKTSWFILYGDDRPAGAFGCWKLGISEKWKSSEKKEYTQAERDAWKQRMRERERVAAEELKAERDAAAAEALELWNASATADDHPYLARKLITGIGARVSGKELLIPMKHGAKSLVGLQRIQADGQKFFIKGTPLEGAYHVIGKPTRIGTVVITEGYATAVSIHLATTHCVVVAFNAGNLLSVSKKIRKAMPDALMILAADDDAWTVYPEKHPKAGQAWNPGAEYAYAAALSVGAKMTAPIWMGDRPHKHTDFNDLHADEGLQAVETCFNNTYDPAPKPDAEQDAGNYSPPDQPESVSLPSAENNPGSIEADPPLSVVDTVQAPGDIMPSDACDVPDDDEDIFVYPSSPLDTVRLFIKSLPDEQKFVYWRGEFYLWNGHRYQSQDPIRIHQMVYEFMDKCLTKKTNLKTGDLEVVAFSPKKSHVEDVMHAIRANKFRELPDAPTWIRKLPGDPEPSDVVAFRNGLLDLKTRKLIPPTYRLFLTNCLDFDFTPDSPAPVEWLKFLQTIWDYDLDSITALQEMLGYLLTDDTSHQKMFMFIGPPRSGKGTILRVLESLVGSDNRVSPSLNNLGNDRGLAPLIGRRVAMISDARMSGRADQQPIVENLLRISGEDSLTIDRKYIASWTGKLSSRFIMASNEPPSFSDASGALANRFIMFQFTKSFLGHEDHGLGARLLKEIPGILLWSLAGLDRLRERGYFVMPESGRELSQEMRDLSSPVSAFVNDRCIFGINCTISIDTVYEEWKKHCDSEGILNPGTASSFSRKLIASTPGIGRHRPGEGDRKRVFTGIRLRGYADDERPI